MLNLFIRTRSVLFTGHTYTHLAVLWYCIIKSGVVLLPPLTQSSFGTAISTRVVRDYLFAIYWSGGSTLSLFDDSAHCISIAPERYARRVYQRMNRVAILIDGKVRRSRQTTPVGNPRHLRPTLLTRAVA